MGEEAIFFDGFITCSDKLKKILAQVSKVASSDVTVLITGETGTGKELIANAIHRLSGRKGNFVPVNCAAIPEEILEAELFGFEKGAFTGAFVAKEGKFQFANHGTIFLDEVGELSLRLQAKLLRVLQEKVVAPLGSNKLQALDVRIVAATNRDLLTEVKQNKFREDLFYRLHTIQFELPPLRERPEDIAVLTRYFFEKFCKKHNKNLVLPRYLIELLKKHQFRGNVRELQNIIERAVLFCEGNCLSLNDFPPYLIEELGAHLHEINFENIDPSNEEPNLSSFSLPHSQGLTETLADLEKRLIQQALKQANGNKTLAAMLLKINRTTLIEKMKRLCVAA